MKTPIKNATSRAGRSDASKNVPKQNKNNTTQLKPLSQECIDELLNSLPPRANQARRFIRFVAENQEATTGQCNVAALAVNLSDLALKYNGYIRPLGYELKCRVPYPLIKNKVSEPTMQHLWYLAEVERVAA